MLKTNKIYCGDCLELMKQMPDKSVDLVFADPPFNISKKYDGKTCNDNKSDYRDWCENWINECFRVLKDNGSFYLMTIDRHLEWKMPIMARNGGFINLIKWRNVSASHSKRNFWNESQPIMLYGKSETYRFNTYAEKQITEDYNLRYGGYSTEPKGQLKDYWADIPFVYAGSIKHPEAIIKEGTNKKAHSQQMPIALPQRGILFSTDENDIILDPFIGSGTTAVAAIRTNRQFIGIEISPEYCKVAEKRISYERQQLLLPLTYTA